jgi:AmmeMemoRadiSam system protein A
MFEERERQQLLALARGSIRRGLGRGSPGSVSPDAWPPALLEPRATFTTLTLAGELRGCCGSLEARVSLVQDVWRNAWLSAFADPRFEPVGATELDRLEISISVLSPLEPVAFADEFELMCRVEPGLDGLVLQIDARRATFLPAVWEMLPEPRRFLGALKRKAGWLGGTLPAGASAWRYRTESFTATREPLVLPARGAAPAALRRSQSKSCATTAAMFRSAVAMSADSSASPSGPHHSSSGRDAVRSGTNRMYSGEPGACGSCAGGSGPDTRSA